MVEVKIKKLRPDAKLPEFANDYAVGADLFSNYYYALMPGEIKAIETGIAIELPDDYQAEIRSRSGLALNHGIFVLNSPGTIDPDYRGEIKVIV
ncbi:MAG: dUTP diphosphatase, partial [Verrucomicrobiia bacterium]